MKEFEDLKQLLNEEDTHFNKTIEKKMDKKISKKVGKYLLCFLLIISFIVSGLHIITKAVKFNPTKTNVKFEYNSINSTTSSIVLLFENTTVASIYVLSGNFFNS